MSTTILFSQALIVAKHSTYIVSFHFQDIPVA